METPNITAEYLYNLHRSLDMEFGHINEKFKYNPTDFENFDQVTDEKIDCVINDILSYTYYTVKLGLNNKQLDKFVQEIPLEIFGITSYNKDSNNATILLSKIAHKFSNKGFDVWLSHENTIKLEWDFLNK